jgi:hypothetical protein
VCVCVPAHSHNPDGVMVIASVVHASSPCHEPFPWGDACPPPNLLLCVIRYIWCITMIPACA